jgi:KUP system potassium uptake protein
MTSNLDVVPPVLLHHFKHNKVLHEQVILFYVVTENVPEVPAEDQVRVYELGDGFYSVVARCGFAETPNVPKMLKQCRTRGLTVKLADTSYYLGRDAVDQERRMSGWRRRVHLPVPQRSTRHRRPPANRASS